MRLLLECGADKEAKSNVRCILRYTAFAIILYLSTTVHFTCLTMTLDAQRASTALVNAAQHGCTDCVRLLLESGADTEARNNVRDRDMSRI